MIAVLYPGQKNFRLSDPCYDIFDNTREFDYFLELASFACDCPFAAIHIGGKEKHWHKPGIDATLILPKNIFSFCSSIMEQDEMMIVTDTRTDPRFQNDPLKAGKQQILFFAGAPITRSDGQCMGCLCVMHVSPLKNFNDKQRNALKTIAHLAACLVDMKMNNQLAKQQADEMILAEKKVNRLTISHQDTEKGFIADKLQENFAQTLAATKLYLEFAEQSSDKSKDHFIQKSRDSIASVIDEIRYLCRSMVPASMGNHQDTVGLLRDMVVEWETQQNIPVDFVCGASFRHLKDHTWFTLFHIVQQQLKLAAYCKAKKIEINLVKQDGLTLYFRMWPVSISEPDVQRELFFNSIYTRVAMVNGKMHLDNNAGDWEVMKIDIPA